MVRACSSSYHSKAERPRFSLPAALSGAGHYHPLGRSVCCAISESSNFLLARAAARYFQCQYVVGLARHVGHENEEEGRRRKALLRPNGNGTESLAKGSRPRAKEARAFSFSRGLPKVSNFIQSCAKSPLPLTFTRNPGV